MVLCQDRIQKHQGPAHSSAQPHRIWFSKRCCLLYGTMPFHSHHPQNAPNNPAAGIYQAAQALGSIGAPTGNLRVATSGTTNAGTDALLPGSGNAPGLQSPGGHISGGQTAPPSASGLPGPGTQLHSNSSLDNPRRVPTLGRTPEELHISTSAAAMGQHASSHASAPAQQQQQMYNSPDQYSAGSAPNINLHQATPQGTQYSNAPAAGNVPGSLQPGSGSTTQQQRPGPSASYTAPSTVPTMPQINTNAQQYTLPTRSSTMNQSQHSSSHTYSRSSPAGLGPEQKYIPFSHTPENPKYAAGTPAQKYFPGTPSGAASNSPLGLADIRPRANSSMNEEGMGAATFFNDSDRVPTNSNYLAPWGVYAFDWCKWNVHGGNSAGKMAIGSYLEDTHNFVGLVLLLLSSAAKHFLRFKSSTHKSPRKKFPHLAPHLSVSNTPASPKLLAHIPLHDSYGNRPLHKSNLLTFSLHLEIICGCGPFLSLPALTSAIL